MIIKTFTGITADQWNEIKAALKERGGFAVGSDRGNATVKGVHFSWDFQLPLLNITILSVSMADKFLGHDENSVMSDFAKWISEIK
jgi:hypothetical protein